MGEVVKFPVKGTKIKGWFDEAACVCVDINEGAAQQWGRKHVPLQFHKLMYANLKAFVNKGNKQ